MTTASPSLVPSEPSARRKRILTLAMPIIGGMVSQNVLNLIDTAMVGSFGNDALAGVGFGGFANFLLTAFILGISSGVQAMASRRKGEERHSEVALPLNGGLLLVCAIAIPWSSFLVATTTTFFPWLAEDPAVVAAGAPYLQARLCAMTAMGMNFAFRGFWNGTDRSGLYMRTLIVMHVTNIVLNWVFIYGNLGAPKLGAAGAGIASAIATYVGTIVYFSLALKHARDEGFLSGLPSRETLRTIARLSIPSGIQQTFFAGGMTAFFWIVGKLGTAEVAANQVLVNIMLVSVLPSLGFGLASASLVGQALGRGDARDAQRWGFDVIKVAVPVVFVLALPGMVVPDWLLYPFLHAEPETLALAEWPLRIVAFGVPLDAAGFILMNSMIGAGDTRRVMIVSVVAQWGVFLPLAYVLATQFQVALWVIWLANIGYRIGQTVIFMGMWKRGSWASIKI